MQFEFATAGRILFGAGRFEEVGKHVAALGRRALVVTGRSTERAAPLLARLAEVGVETTAFSVPREPTTALVCEAVRQAADFGCDCVVGFGGGSVVDAGKAIAVLRTNPGEPLDYLEVVGRGQPLTQPALPFVAVPTTAGTGAEVTRNAVLASPDHRLKVSLRSPLMLPRLALVDPLLTHSMSPDLTAATGLDALTQLLEPYVSRQANPLTDGLCREGLRRAAGALRRAYADGADAPAREAMALASLLGGLALANAKLGAVHGLAGVLGGSFDAPHGALCGRLLPYVTEVNVATLRAREPQHPALRRFDEIAALLTGDPAARAADGVAWLHALAADLAAPGLASYGITAADFPEIAAQALRSSSMQGNPIALTEEELQGILERAL